MPSETMLRASDWNVVDVDRDQAFALVVLYHYAKGAANTSTYLHGMVPVDDPKTVWGVAWWIPPLLPASRYVAQRVGCTPAQVLQLHRLAIHPDAPKCSASFLIGRSERLIRRDGRFFGLVTYADTRQGHTGAIYKATNWDYDGMTRHKPIWVDLKTGAQVSPKAKVNRNVATMRALGYVCVAWSRKHRFLKSLTGRGYGVST